MSSPTDFKGKLSALRQEVEAGLQQHLPAAETRPARLHTAMRYSLEAGGKRLRPVLTLAVADLWQQRARALPAAVAIECVHTYSLIHDDLPAMDNDDLRRGRPTCHKQFDEATAILAGDALLTHAFQVLADAYPASALGHALLARLTRAAGSRHLIGGQMEDILAEKRTDVSAADLEFIHHNKTGAMLEASLTMGGLCGGATETELASLAAAGRHLGLAFQIVDDILDATASSAALGKTAGKDAAAGKATFVSVHGLAVAREQAGTSSAAAITALRRLSGDTSFLVQLAQSMLERQS